MADPYKIRLVPHRVLVGRVVPDKRAEPLQETPAEVFARFSLGATSLVSGAFIAEMREGPVFVLYLGAKGETANLERKHPGFTEGVQRIWRVELPPRGRLADDVPSTVG